MKPAEPKVVPVPWWERGAETPYTRDMFGTGVPNAESKHPHWTNPRIPGRKVLRQQARRRGELRPMRVRGRRRAAPVGRIFQSPAVPLIPSFLNNFGRGGDR